MENPIEIGWIVLYWALFVLFYRLLTKSHRQSRKNSSNGRRRKRWFSAAVSRPNDREDL